VKLVPSRSLPFSTKSATVHAFRADQIAPNDQEPAMKKLLIVVLLGCLPVVAIAQPWADNFDSYPTGQNLQGVGGWKGWFNNPTATAFTTDLFSRSAPNSVEITGTSDLVREFSGANSGLWVMTAWQYIPGNLVGSTYFILLNQYDDAGANLNWSTQLECGNGVIESEFENLTLPLIFDQWVEIRVEIDLDVDVQNIYYDGTLLSSKSWTGGVTGGGLPTIGAIDLFGNDASPIYYDDIVLDGGATAVEPTSWGRIKAHFE
jgi:hypothetical protein